MGEQATSAHRGHTAVSVGLLHSYQDIPHNDFGPGNNCVIKPGPPPPLHSDVLPESSARPRNVSQHLYIQRASQIVFPAPAFDFATCLKVQGRESKRRCRFSSSFSCDAPKHPRLLLSNLIMSNLICICPDPCGMSPHFSSKAPRPRCLSLCPPPAQNRQ